MTWGLITITPHKQIYNNQGIFIFVFQVFNRPTSSTSIFKKEKTDLSGDRLALISVVYRRALGQVQRFFILTRWAFSQIPAVAPRIFS